MMSVIFLILFAVILIGCVALNASMVIALLIGLIIFLVYAYLKGFRFKEMLKMCLTGVKTVSGILITLLLIGMLTASWRAAATIPTIVSYAAKLINPSIFIFISFILCSLLSMLTGTSFGTAATMGTVCMSIALALGVSPVWTGGAILSGAFFGDRCSPFSTSALLVATITKTDLYDNIKNMLRTAFLPFLLCSATYLTAGFVLSEKGIASPFDASEITKLFSTEFRIDWICLIPAIIIIILAILRINLKLSLSISAVSAVVISLAFQKMQCLELLKALFCGFRAINPELSVMLDGGGFVSMVKTCLIVMIASCYQGIFKETGMLNFLEGFILRAAKKFGNFFCYFILSIMSSMIGCNQTLAIMLTSEMTEKLEDAPSIRALNIENTAVVIAPLIPWSIAGSVPIETIGAPMKALLFATFLYILPLCELLKSWVKKKKK